MDINLLMNLFENSDIGFFTGVPDSLLAKFCNYLMSHYGVNNQNHIVAHNEGGSVALASGYHFATGKVPCVYMQNSGIGNSLNPIVSLANQKIYGVPMLFIIGWRGEPGTKDEPQHVLQGEITLKLLSDMEIDYFIVDKDTCFEQLEEIMEHYRNLFSIGKSAALVVRKGAFSGSDYEYRNNYLFNREQAIQIIVEATSDDPIISTTGKISRELYELRESRGDGHERDFLTVGSMGHNIMIALGIAIQKPEHRIWCIDGDGAVLMHMGGMGIVGNQSPANFYHIVLNNVAHETVGGMPTVAESIDFIEIARACGYNYVYKAHDAVSLNTVLDQAKHQKGPVFIEVLVALGSRPDLGRPKTTTMHNKLDFMRFLSNTEENGCVE